MEEQVRIYCRNNGQTISVPMGATLEDIYPLTGLQLERAPVLAHVNNKVEGMHYRVYNPREVEFLDITSTSGLRAYTRSLFFVLCKPSTTSTTMRRCRLTFPCRTATMSTCDSTTL